MIGESRGRVKGGSGLLGGSGFAITACTVVDNGSASMTRRDLLAIAALAAAAGIVDGACAAEPESKSGGGGHDASSWRGEEGSCRQLREGVASGEFSAASRRPAFLYPP